MFTDPVNFPVEFAVGGIRNYFQPITHRARHRSAGGSSRGSRGVSGIPIHIHNCPKILAICPGRISYPVYPKISNKQKSDIPRQTPVPIS